MSGLQLVFDPSKELYDIKPDVMRPVAAVTTAGTSSSSVYTNMAPDTTHLLCGAERRKPEERNITFKSEL